MAYNFKQRQWFYHEYQKTIEWGYFGRIVGDWLYLDNRAKKRPFAPPEEAFSKFIEERATWLLENKNMRGRTHEQLCAALRDTRTAINAEIDQRLDILKEERQRGITAPNSLAISKLDPHLLRLVHDEGHFRTGNELRHAPDEVIKAIPGIDNKKLGQVRKIFPKVVIPAPRPQPSLFATD